MTDKTDKEHRMTISRSYSRQAVNSLGKTIKYLNHFLWLKLHEPLSVNVKAEDRRAETMLTRSSLQTWDKVTQQEAGGRRQAARQDSFP